MSLIEKIIHRKMDKIYYNERNIVHRDNGPAIKYANGSCVWVIDGKISRKDGPAIINADGSKLWLQNDKRHRIDGPAIEFISGSKYWIQNGQLHREDGPAVELHDGYTCWYYKNIKSIFLSEKILKQDIDRSSDIKSFIANNVYNLNPSETFLLRLTIANHFPKFIHTLENYLSIQ